MRFKGSILITDPCYLKNSKGAEHIERNTIYGDWSCMVYPGTMEENKNPDIWAEHYKDYWNKLNYGHYDDDVKEKLIQDHDEFKAEWKNNIYGEFCADSGMVGVYSVDEVDDKDLEWCRKYSWCATIIDDFDGDVEFVVKDNEVHVVGTGNKPFFSTQSGY